jgi:hypothetical protein
LSPATPLRGVATGPIRSDLFARDHSQVLQGRCQRSEA